MMMAMLFLIFFVAMVLIAIGWRIPAMIVIAINMVISFFIFLQHMQTQLNINL